MRGYDEEDEEESEELSDVESDDEEDLRDNQGEVVTEEDHMFICGPIMDYNCIEKLPPGFNKQLLTMYEENETAVNVKRGLLMA